MEARGLTDAIRWVDRDDYTVDLFGDVAVLSTYAAVDEAAIARELCAQRPLRAVYVKRRPKQAHGVAAGEVAPVEPICGTAVESLVVQEDGVRFEVRPANGLSVGLYLDAGPARAWVRRHAAGRSVLNLFSYTCGFGVAASLGGASRVLNIDLSRKVLDWGEQNYALNGLQPARRDFVAGDCFDWLARLQRKAERFDLVVLDPPSFATTKKSRFSAAKDYPGLLAAAAAVGDEVLACCNLDGAPLQGWVKGAGLRWVEVLPPPLPAVVARSSRPRS